MGVASGCGEQEVGVASGSGWNLWVWLLGVVLRRYIDFLILLIPTPLVSVLFCSSIPTFCSFYNKSCTDQWHLGGINCVSASSDRSERYSLRKRERERERERERREEGGKEEGEIEEGEREERERRERGGRRGKEVEGNKVQVHST